MRGPLLPVMFVMAIVIATAFLFVAAMGIVILWALPVLVLSLAFAARRVGKPSETPLPRVR
jgi:hypothetical protein